jgi:hypothetical protein
LIAPGGAAHEDPRVVEAAKDHKRPEQQWEQRHKREDNPKEEAA